MRSKETWMVFRLFCKCAYLASIANMTPNAVQSLVIIRSILREVLGNPSPTPQRFPETREISRGKSRGSQEISWAPGMDFPIPNSSLDLVEYGHSLIIYLSIGSGQGGIDSVKSILPCWWWENVQHFTPVVNSSATRFPVSAHFIFSGCVKCLETGEMTNPIVFGNRRNNKIPWKVIIIWDFFVLLFLDTF